MEKLVAGDLAPAFTLSDSDGNTVSLSDYAGKRIVLYFYPAALTPGCTTQACDFTSAHDALATAGYEVIGISPDKPQKLARFHEKHGLPFVLLSDPDKATLTAYGAFGQKKLYGKSVLGVIRSTFTIAVDDSGIGRIEMAWTNVRATGHVAKLLRELPEA